MLDPADVAPQPWRNGGGVTRELATGPGWRVSVADLTAAGRFSSYPGTSRLFTPLDDGVVLAVDEARCETRRHRPVVFPGDAEVELVELAAPSRALNVITRADAPAPAVRVDALAAAAPAAPPPLLSVLLGDHVAHIWLTPIPATTPATQEVTP